ncbi:hypothetical protein HII17_01505 [Thalassotalea sp. M1531]|uniref:Manganese efflux pump MntP n=1 Tax=Thalassotalea algicola TaxID=2716224 RepID=A0A7Y0L9P4_9GAMM|nr:manganese efflux pump [Thalassotalea algicola]NMP30224.1 hypothetical protein [Thalassotalea algicola]
MGFPLLDFALASVLMGLGIGLDVAIATVARSGQLATFKTAALWVIGVSLTHTLFPMVGYLLTYFSVQVMPEITPVIGILAFVCIFLYLKGEFIELAHPEQKNEHSQILITLGLILAVSWDALWSGPAKSAQVIGWPELMVWVSFILVGGMVSILAIMSLRMSQLLNHYTANRPYLAWIGSWVQYAVIGYFGLLALVRYTLVLNLYWWQILLISCLLVGVCMLLCIQSRNSEMKLRPIT